MQPDVVFLSGKMSEERPELGGLLAPWSRRVEGGVQEGAGREEELQSFRTGDGEWGNVHEVWVSVPVFPRVGRRDLLQANSGIEDFC